MWKRNLPLLFVASMAGAQNFTINTIAGGGPVAAGQPATSYGLDGPRSVAVDSSGNLYVALSNWCQVWVVNSSGTLTQVIGNGVCGFSGDNGPAASAQLGPNLLGTAVDNFGNLYIADSSNGRVRKVSGGIITTVAGGGVPDDNGDLGDGGSATDAVLGPQGIAVDTVGSLYIADTSNGRIRKVVGGIITTVAGSWFGSNADNISATSATLSFPAGVAVDNSFNLYIAETGNNRIRKVSWWGTITTVAGGGSDARGEGISATSAALNLPSGIAVDNAGRLYITETGNNRIREVSEWAFITTLAGSGTPGYNGDNISATSAELSFPNPTGIVNTRAIGVAVDNSGNLFIADVGNDRIRKVSSGIITTVVGHGVAYGGDGAVAMSAQLNRPGGTAVDSGGNLFIVDSIDCVVRKVAAGTGIISTVVGIGGACGYNGDGISATSARISPLGVAVDNAGDLYIADSNNQRVRKVSGGIITTVAGNGNQGYSGDGGSATSAELHNVSGVAVDSSGNLYIADVGNFRVRKVSGGIVTTVAGNGTGSYSGDGSSAVSTGLVPSGVAVDYSGNLYIVNGTSRILKVSGGIITTVAGNGTEGYNGDNISATSAALSLSNPAGVAVDNSGNLYIADLFCRIRKVSGGIITTVAGNGTHGFSGDGGVATSAQLNSPSFVTVDTSGIVYISDTLNNRIRRLTPTSPVTVSVNVTSSPAGLTLIVDGTSITTPQVFAWIPGSCHTVSANTQAVGTGTQYLPVGTFPADPCFSSTGSYNVNFTTQYYLSTSAGTGGTISPPSGWYNSGTGVSVFAMPVAGYSFANFSGALTGTTNPQSISMNAPASVFANFAAQGSGGLDFYPVTPCRVADTRPAAGFTGQFGPPSMTGGQTRIFNIPSSPCGVPATAAAYSLNITVVTKGYLGILSIWPAGQPMPNISTLNSYSTTSTVIANAAIVPAGTNGAISVYVTDATDLIIDINGYFQSAANGLKFFPVTPCRLVDTRVSSFQSEFGPPSLAAGATRSFTIPSNNACGIPSSAAAYSLNMTAVPRTTLGFLSIWPAGQPLPNVSTLNVYNAGTVVANAAIVPAGTGGAINAYVTDATDLVVDVNGYFAPLSANGLKFYPATPCRVADTRVASFPTNLGPLSMGAGTQRSFPVTQSTCGVPSNAGAYSFNFTAVPHAPQLGIFVTWPTGQPQPNVSTMNSYNGSVVANAAIVPAGLNGAISIYVTDISDVLFDINGYFAP